MLEEEIVYRIRNKETGKYIFTHSGNFYFDLDSCKHAFSNLEPYLPELYGKSVKEKKEMRKYYLAQHEIVKFKLVEIKNE